MADGAHLFHFNKKFTYNCIYSAFFLTYRRVKNGAKFESYLPRPIRVQKKQMEKERVGIEKVFA
jgi:hypothetical protein